jgi:hypothetical protein
MPPQQTQTLPSLLPYRHARMSLSRPAEPWSCPIKPGTASTSFLSLSMHAIPKISALWLRQHLYFPLQHSLQPPTSIPILTLSLLQLPGRPRSKLHRGVMPGCSTQARSLLPGPPFGSTNLDRFLRTRTSHDSAASTRRGPSTCSTCSPSHQGPADRAVKAGKMLLSLAGRTPRLGKRRPWSRNQTGKGGVGLRYHTPGEARGPNLQYCTYCIVDSGICERVSHCLHATQNGTIDQLPIWLWLASSRDILRPCRRKITTFAEELLRGGICQIGQPPC